MVPIARYVLVFIEFGSRRIHLSPAAAHPNSAWVTQQARNLAMNLDGRSPAIRFPIPLGRIVLTKLIEEALRAVG
jgi:hypothetical protein